MMKTTPFFSRKVLPLIVLGLAGLLLPTRAISAQEPMPPDGVEAASRNKAYLPFVVQLAKPRTPGNAPYPTSPVIESVSWDLDSLSRAANGSDLFPLTWADDGELYTAWGDGQGFDENGDKDFMGVSRISGAPESYSGQDIWSGSGKAHGILSIDGKLYLAYSEQDGWMRGRVGYSSDRGKTWVFDSKWTFSEPQGAFASPAFLQFGQDYAGARDRYVYGYSERVRETIQPDVVLFRAPKDRLLQRNAYEFFAGLDGRGQPKWTTDIDAMQPVFSDPNGVTWGMEAVYNPVLKRYLLTVRHDDDSSGWGLFDAPEPWGPWTTVAYYDHWLDSTPKIMYSFNQKWMSADGRTMWMAFSGLDEYDSFNLIKAVFKIK